MDGAQPSLGRSTGYRASGVVQVDRSLDFFNGRLQMVRRMELQTGAAFREAIEQGPTLLGKLLIGAGDATEKQFGTVRDEGILRGDDQGLACQKVTAGRSQAPLFKLQFAHVDMKFSQAVMGETFFQFAVFRVRGNPLTETSEGKFKRFVEIFRGSSEKAANTASRGNSGSCLSSQRN